MSFFEKGELKLLWRLYFGTLITGAFSLVPAFMLVYLIGLGMSLTKVGFLLGVLSIAQILFEIPTGAIADKYGRKFSVLLGELMGSVLFISLFFITSYYALFIIFFLLGIVGTLSSGSGESWIYDLIMKKNKKILHSYYSKHQVFGAMGLVISGFIGAFVVANFGINYIWIISGLASFAYLIIIFPVEEVYTIKKEHKEKFGEIWKQSLNSIKYTLKHKVLLYLFLAGFFMIISVVFAESLGYVPYLKGLGLPDYAFGYFFSGMALVLALAPLAIKLFNTKGREIRFLVSTTIVGSVILLLTYFAKNYIQASLIIFFSLFFFGIKYPIERVYLNKFIPTKTRATVLSFQSMVYSLAGAIALPIGGFLIDKIGALYVILISALLGIPCVLAYLMIKRKN
jgi:MFS family permease